MKIRGVRKSSLFLVILIAFSITLHSQTKTKFQRKISGYLSKDEVEKAECFCNKLKSNLEQAECYEVLGEMALEEFEYVKAYDYFLKSRNKEKLYETFLEASNNDSKEILENHLIKSEAEKSPDASDQTNEKYALMPIADLCYSMEDYKNAGDYYEKAGIKQIANECKVLHAVKTQDYITAVEISEEHAVGLKDPQSYYTLAAEQYYRKGDYLNALKYYQKVNDKVNSKHCFTKGLHKETELALSNINANIIDYSESIDIITYKHKSLKKEVANLGKYASIYKKNGFKKEAEYWYDFSRQLKRLLKATANDSYLIDAFSENLNPGSVLLQKSWNEMANLTLQNEKKLNKNKLNNLSYLLDELVETKKLYSIKISNEATGKLNQASNMEVATLVNASKTIELVEEEMIKTFEKCHSNDSLSTFYFNFCSIKKLNEMLLDKIDNLVVSEKSIHTKSKLVELKNKHILFFNNKIQNIQYFKSDFIPLTWKDFLLQRKLGKINNELKVENSKMLSQKI